jgi:hypothetical protein
MVPASAMSLRISALVRTRLASVRRWWAAVKRNELKRKRNGGNEQRTLLRIALSLVDVLLPFLLVLVGRCGARNIDSAGLPYETLEYLVLVLLLHERREGVENFANIAHELAPLVG